MTLGNFLIEQRNNASMSINVVAELMDVSARHIRYIESGGKKPGTLLLCKLSNIYNFSLDEIKKFYI